MVSYWRENLRFIIMLGAECAMKSYLLLTAFFKI